MLCETIKFTERVALDSIVHNEIAPADELVIPRGPLEKWVDVKNLQLCNPMYDVTPAEYITMIITESGNVPPTSVPLFVSWVSVMGIHTERNITYMVRPAIKPS